MGEMNLVKIQAHAKLNLTLDVLGKKGAFHEIDSLVVTIDLSDKIVLKKRRDKQIRLSMYGMGSEQILPEENNAMRAAEAFVKRFETSGAEISVYKNIPIGAGLGGSSADAAGVLNGLSKLYEINEESALKALADELGSDTGYLLKGGFARLKGRGEEVQDLGVSPSLFALLLIPEGRISTAECYQKSDLISRAALRTEEAKRMIDCGNLDWAKRLFSNGLFEAAKTILPDVALAVRELSEFSPQAVVMTGSGSGVYALFETEELCRWALSRYRGKFRALCVKTE